MGNNGFWVLLAIDVVVAIAIFAARNWLKAWLERGVQHRFDERLEQLRTQLRNSEEQFRSSLRKRESEIAALRDGVLSGHIQRQALLDKRRLEAIERLWSAITSLASYRNLAASMAVIKADVVAKAAPQDAQLREFFAGMTKVFNPTSDRPDNPAKNERPFLSQLAWAYFVAYQTVVQGSFAYAKMLELGIKDPDSLLNLTKIKDVIATALPDQAEFIQKNHPLQYYFLVEELENRVLAEIDKMLRGVEQTEQNMMLARKIIESASATADNVGDGHAKE